MATVKHQTYDGNGNLLSETDVVISDEVVNRDAIFAAARAALVNNKTFIDSVKPGTTAAQANQAYDQAVKLSRQVNGLIRVLLGAFESAE